MKKQLYLLIDCNNFFASCERLFRPDLAKKPVAILSNNDGCIIARSNEVKALGIPMGAPLFKVKDIIDKHNVTLFSSNFELYADISHRVMSILKTYTPDIQIYSVDEAFLYYPHLENPEELGHRIRSHIKKHVGIPVSIGIAPSKTLAKLANHFAKTSQKDVWIFTHPPGKSSLEKIPIDEIWGLGRRSKKRLAKYNINSVWDFKIAPTALIKKALNINGVKTQTELDGIPCLGIDEDISVKKAILSSRSFGERVTHINPLRGALARNVSIAARKLRKQDSQTNIIYAFIRTSPYSPIPYNASGYIVLPEATDDTVTLINATKQILNEIYKPHLQYAKSGVYLVNLTPKTRTQLHLFDSISEKRHALMECMDMLNDKFKPNIIHPAITALGKENYDMKQTLRSPRYCTKWDELCLIKIE